MLGEKVSEDLQAAKFITDNLADYTTVNHLYNKIIDIAKRMDETHCYADKPLEQIENIIKCIRLLRDSKYIFF